MKNIVYFLLIMLSTIIILPLIIVRGCSVKNDTNYIEFPKTNELKVYIVSEKKTVSMDLEEYTKSVVAAEMPAEFDSEALKAQAVAARTYAYARMNGLYTSRESIHPDAHVCTDFSHCQGWISMEEAKKNWGKASAEKYWNKIEKAVKDTENIVIYYGDTIIDPLFHSCSGGKTADASEVWPGQNIPYLVSVDSPGEEINPNYTTSISITAKDFIDKIKTVYSDFKADENDVLKDVKILDYTASGRVGTFSLAGYTMTATQFRDLFLLKSAFIKLEQDSSKNVIITTTGSGHGVGMSQWGANYRAKNGSNYEEILKYYYKGVTLKEINRGN